MKGDHQEGEVSELQGGYCEQQVRCGGKMGRSGKVNSGRGLKGGRGVAY